MEVVIENEAKLLIRLFVKKDYEKEETERRANLNLALRTVSSP